MRALVVYESMFGNTRQVAEAVAGGLRSGMEVDVAEVGSAPPTLSDDVHLLVVGAPTHAFGMSWPRTRQSAAEQANGQRVPTGPGLREWLRSVEVPAGTMSAAFDTKANRPRLPGSAARGARRRLARLGCPVLGTANFYVEGVRGPLVAGEEERAGQWASELLPRVTGTGG